MKPFNLEKALAGEPVKLRNGKKAFLIKDLSYLKEDIGFAPDKPLVGLIYAEHEIVCWRRDGRISFTNDEALGDIVSMWEEPRPTVTLTLPAPLKEPQDGMWFINNYFSIIPSTYGEDGSYSEDLMHEGRYFASKEDAQAWLYAMCDSRR